MPYTSNYFPCGDTRPVSPRSDHIKPRERERERLQIELAVSPREDVESSAIH